ncbi:hypothetical protein [Rhizobacter sp. LjRoot28]|uniref:hypothetical protein n=1 Tax=Rhizobacter sp. LjRoot28 TaxID=3342309 RepID=UPI003ECF0AAA
MSGIQNTTDLHRTSSQASISTPQPTDTTPTPKPHSKTRDVAAGSPHGRTSPSSSRPPQRALPTAATPEIAPASTALSIRSVHSAREAAAEQAAAHFDTLLQAGQARKLTDKDVINAVLFQALSVGGGAAFAFGLGRSLGADVAEMIVRAAFGSPQLAGVGPDTTQFGESDRQTAMMLTNAVARWVGATVGGGIGAAVGNVAAPRMATMTGKQLLPVPANELVPDHVAQLLKPDGTPYGTEGVAQLRAEVAAAQKEYGAVGGGTHIHAGELAFGAENALRGLGQGKQPMGAPVDATVSTVVSATAGAATGAYAAFEMARHRLQVPDARHSGPGSAPLVGVPTFRPGDPAPIPDRFTGPTAGHTALNIAAGTGDRIAQMAKATLPLGAANVTGTAMAAALPETPGDIGHRVVQATESGAGVAAAVSPWFQAQPGILAKDKARIAAQQQRADDVEMGRRDPAPEGSAAVPRNG